MNRNEYFNTDYLKQNLKTRAIQGAGATFFAQICSYGVQIIGAIILARLLTPDDFGLIAMVLAFSLLLQNFGVNGFTEAVIQKENISHRQLSTLFWINIAISLLLTLLLIASSPLIAGFYKEPRLKSITMAMAFSIIIGGLSTHHLALLKRNMQFYRTSANDMAAAIFSVTISIVLAYKGYGYWALVSRQLFLPLITTMGAWILCTWRPELPALGSGTKSMVKFALNAYGNFCVFYFQRNLDKVLIGRFLGSQPLGHYDRANNLSNMVPNQLIIPLTSVALATLSRLANDSEKYRYYLSTLISMLAFIALPMSLILTLTGRDLIYLLLGPQWNKAGEIFSVLGLGTGMIILYNIHGWLHLSLGRADRWFRWSIAALVVTIILYLIGLPFGSLGVAIAYTASFCVLIVPAMWYAGKPAGIKLSLFISAIWKYFMSALIAGLSCWFLLYSFKMSANIFLELNIYIRILISSLCSMSIYLILIIIFHQSTKPILQFASILRDMIPKS